MRIDLGLEVSVDAFVEAVTEALVAATASLPDTDPDELRASVVTEAFQISCAFIDADGLATDDELWGLIRAFGTRLGPDFARAVPDDLRRDGTTTGAQQWARTPSDLFEILVGVDRRDHTDRATTYYTHAMALAHTVASLDTHTGRDELLALDAYRSLLLATIKADAPPSPTFHVPNLGPQGAPERTGPPQSAGEAVEAAAEEAIQKADPPARDLDDLLDELDALVGLAEVKREVRLVANLLQVQRLRQQRGLPVVASSRHLVFTGNPGTGKTTVARLLAQIYRTLGVVSRGHLVESDRSRLVAGYVGQTASKVTAAFDEADEGVLLIDEAYALVRGSDTDFGREAIDTIVKLVEDRRDRLVVIVAGYPDEMQSFLEANPGLPSRFPRTIAFPDYTDDELIAIFESQCSTGGYRCDDGASAALRAAIEATPRGKGFGNGRLVRNLFERAIERQASRLVDDTDPTDLELTMLTGADLVEPSGGAGGTPS
jgi:SpoVK/Ycf46/Vps4 family AAA+-type ATPase